MDVSTIARTQIGLAQIGQTSQSGSVGGASQMLTPASKRIGQQLESTNVRLSAYGQIKSSFSGAQTSATALTNAATSKTATTSDVAKAAQAFVDAYNQAAKSVSSATATGKQAGALATDLRAKSAGNDLASLTRGNGLANLKQAGITANTDGTLSLDTKALNSALQANPSATKNALSAIGQQVSASTGRELASTGNVGSSVNRLNSRAETLTAQQASLQQQAANLQSQTDKQGAVLNYAVASNLAAYKSLLG